MNFVMTPLKDLLLKVEKWNPAKEAGDMLIKYIDLSSVDKDSKQLIADEVQELFGSNAPSRARQLVSENDILVATVRPNLNGVASVPCEFEGATASTGYCVLRVNEKLLDSKYLFYWVQTELFVNEMISKASGANYPAVSDKIIKDSKIPLPPLEEQKRIAAILDKADAIRQKRKQAIDLADEFLRSVFLDMFGDPVANPKGWEKKPLVELATQDKRAIVDGPFGASLKTDEYIESGVPVIRINNICERKFVNENFKYITEEKYEELKRSSVEKNDVLVARVGHTIGKACVFDQKFKALLSTTGVCKITCEQSKIHHGFLEALWANGSFQKYIKGFAKGAGQPYYNLTTIKAFEIIKPPLELQHRYIELSQQVAFAVDRAECSYEQLENIFKSLNQKAFSGQL
ncbi:restriction endonuclease subunit S [Vibrio cholerae]|uniref:restriction endonuclease subunit S n=1 Tax=Vibrio cholerae TaxID=666 RepID=UPI000511040C|nr:restriction endonuclease subunit S [Vibrio cholerae]QEO75327.1 restriction endonuclease subunit S [synthetic construct]EGR0604828.1 restriction endonuclease subunit S [Vibrio cholerae]EGR4481149.1 restriction endonuclease subunit S [Vibrio cholerae]EJL6433695.1 restriction endonuclease subunit S [Vibrio cholerae]EKF9705417.1 restriction endonuclease subunit S [Vibrio cholerae]